MAITAGAPVAIVNGGSGTVPYPSMGQQGGAWAIARLTNASPFPLRLYLGGQYLETLGAWTANVYPLQPPNAPVGGSPARLTYVVVTPANLPPPGAGDSTLYSDFGLFGDTFGGASSYPQPLASQAIAAAIAGLVLTAPQQQILLNAAAFSIPASSVITVALTTPVPAFAQAVGIQVNLNTPIAAAVNQQLIVGTTATVSSFPDSDSTGWSWQSSGAGNLRFTEEFIFAVQGDGFVSLTGGTAAITGTVTVVAYAAGPAELARPGPSFYNSVASIGLGTANIITPRVRLFAATLDAVGGSTDYAAYLLDGNGVFMLAVGSNQFGSIEWPGGLLLQSQVLTGTAALRLQTAGTTAAALRGHVAYSYA